MSSPLSFLVACLAVLAGGAGESPPSTAPPLTLEAVETGGLEARSAALILSGQEGGDLDVSFVAVPAGQEAERMRVTVAVDIAAESLLEGVRDESLVIEVYSFVLDAVDSVVDFLGQVVTLDPAATSDLSGLRGVKFLAALELPPGEHSLRVLVLQRQTGRFGLRKATLVLPAAQGASPSFVVSPLFFADGADWIVVRQAGMPDALDTFGLPSAGYERLLPATRGVAAGGALTFFLVGRGIPNDLEARILTSDGTAIEVVELALGPPRVAASQVELVPATLSTAALEQGSYLLEIDVGDDWTPPTATPFDVPGSELDTGLQPTAVESERSGRRGSIWRDLRSIYVASLLSLPSDPSAARDAVMAIERAAVESGRSNAWARLAATFSEVALGLGRNDAESLVPLLLLHTGILTEYHQRQQLSFAAHARRMAWRLLEIYVNGSEADGVEHLAACVLSSLAGDLLDAGAILEAQAAFEQALRYREDHAAALLGLGTIHEALGDHDRAVDDFRRLLELQPESHEVELRLAINLRRLGRTRQARNLLRKRIAGNESDWVAALAHQEMADVLSEERRFDEAARLLRRALDLWPHLERLHIQLASILDSAGQPRQARITLERLTLLPRQTAHSPRALYGSWPTWAIEEDRRVLDDAVAARLPRFEDSLNALVERDNLNRSSSDADPGEGGR